MDVRVGRDHQSRRRDPGPEPVVQAVAPHHPPQIEVPALASGARRRRRKQETRRYGGGKGSRAPQRPVVEAADRADGAVEQRTHVAILRPEVPLEETLQRARGPARLRDHEEQQRRVPLAVEPVAKPRQTLPRERAEIGDPVEGPRGRGSERGEDPANVVLDRLHAAVGERGGDPARDFAIFRGLVSLQERDRIARRRLRSVGTIEALQAVCENPFFRGKGRHGEKREHSKRKAARNSGRALGVVSPSMTPPPAQKTVLVGISSRALPRELAEEHLDELARLVETAGGAVVGRFVQPRSAPDPATFIGRGSVEEIGAAARDLGATLVVFDDELSPGQARNLEKRWEGIRVLDRPGIILDVFASHARTREARTQVELARLQYLLPRLAGRYGHLSGLRGGIGGRGGAGEQKLELDRRRIRDRIARLRRDLARIETAREVRRRGREGRFQVAIAGYTNAGKTTLFNRLTRESAYAADRLFATLDARLARASSPRLSHVVFIDTVGFVRKLPPALVASFRSTLAEIRDADLVLHVVDPTSPRADEERRVATEVLGELSVDPSRTVTVWTKRDLSGARAAPEGFPVSAVTGAGIALLEAEILRRSRPETAEFRLTIPYESGREIARARARFRVLEESDRGDALFLRVAGEERHLGTLREYLVRGEPRRAAGK